MFSSDNSFSPPKPEILPKVSIKTTIEFCVTKPQRYLDYSTSSFRILSEEGCKKTQHRKLAVDIYDEHFEKPPGLCRRLLDHDLNNDAHLQFLLNCGPDYKATWKRRNNVPEVATYRYFGRMRRVLSRPIRIIIMK